MRYGVFSGPDGYPTDMRNTNKRFDLWQIQSSDYPADMRKSILVQEMRPSGLFGQRPRVCACVQSVVSQDSARFGQRGNGRKGGLLLKAIFALGRVALGSTASWLHTTDCWKLIIMQTSSRYRA